MMRGISRTASQRNKKAGQRGVFMISALIMVIVFGAILTLWAEQESRRTRNARADAIGDALAVLGDHLDTYIKDNHKAIVARTGLTWPAGGGTPPVAIANASVITADQLIKWMRIRGAGTRPPYMPQSNYVIRIDVDGCRAGSDDRACKVTGLVYIDSPIVTRGRPDPLMAARAAQKVGRNGGYTTPDSPGTIRFNDGNGAVPDGITNPVANNPVGVLARRIGDVYSAQNEDYLLRDGSKPMRGNLNLSTGETSYDIHGIKGLNAQYANVDRGIEVPNKLAGQNNWGILVGQFASGGRVIGSPVGILASGDISSHGTLYGVKADIRDGIWVKDNHRNSKYGLWVGDWTGDDKVVGTPVGIKASGDIESLGTVKADYLEAKKSLISRDGLYVYGHSFADGGLTTTIDAKTRYWSHDFYNNYGLHVNVGNDRSVSSAMKVRWEAQMFDVRVTAVVPGGRYTKDNRDKWTEIPFGRWVMCNGDIDRYREQEKFDDNDPYQSRTRLSVSDNYEWVLRVVPLRYFGRDRDMSIQISCFGKLL